MRTQIFDTFKITALAVALSFGLSYVYAWTAPTVAPTGGNVLAPINTSGTAQTKAGGLNIATGSGNNVGIGATAPIRKLHLSDTNVVEMVMGATDGLANSRLWNFVVDGPAGTAKNFYIRQLNDAGTGGSIPLFIRGSDANVGIGTTVTAQKLTVAGTIGATGDICTTTTGPSVCLGSAGAFPDYSGGISHDVNTTYQASTNGYLSVVAWGPYMNDLDIWVGPSSANTLIWRMGDDLNSYTKGGSAMIPIKAGTYYHVASPGAYWIQQYAYENIIVNFFPAN